MTQVQLPKKILILSANPIKTPQLRLDQEVREIKEVLQKARNRDSFEVLIETAVRTRDIQQIMLEHRPQIVHFCGHGDSSQGLAFEDIDGRVKFVTAKALSTLFWLCAADVECVVLNACYSVAQAKGIANHIKYVVAMRQAVGDKAAIEYARGFYLAIFSGKAYDIAHEFGRSAIQIENLGEEMTPIIKKKERD
ncbi:CHAT domain-containing protein [Microcoleus sp. FACHB-68]|uniref:CHAT domain-containing protein n=1 Tax=Microcoleus sp. FACHB-68 TaxID=2692826 RepID=UPI00168357B0|nr:CHAT domain-containing protein [Microcoleus sp. FACHB-68]MBD1935796.1 CHAT domain-containing protein [Microcoleus sp. FACHB-68]